MVEINNHPKYGTEKEKCRRSNGWRRSKIRQHKLEISLKNNSNRLWTTGVFFNEDKKRLIWFSNLWHRKYWRENFNRRIRHIKNMSDHNFYRKLFYLVLNCDRISLHCNRVSYNGIKKSRRKYKEKIISNKICKSQEKVYRRKWTPIYGRI